MKNSIWIAAASSLVLATSLSAQTSATEPTTTVKVPVKPATEPVLKPRVPTRVPIKPVIRPRGQTAQANTTIAPVVKPAIRLMDFDNTNQGDYKVRFIVPGVGETPARRLIVEHKGACDFTTSAWEGNPTPPATQANVGCHMAFEKYRKAVEALAANPPAHSDYYQLTVDKYDRATESHERFLKQPVMAVVRTPGSLRVTRHKLYLVAAEQADNSRQRVDRDGDGYEGIFAGGLDCDDNNPNRNPGMTEIPNQEDEDCNLRTIGTLDRDGDGFTDWRISNPPAREGGYPVTGEDCDDTRRNVNPGVPEDLTNGIDDNCDGDVDFNP